MARWVKMWEPFSKLLHRMRSRKGFLICFTGMDGSGKTSHAKSLYNYLSKQGYACYYARSGIRPILSYLFYGFTWLLGYWKRTVSNGEYSIDPLGQAPKNIRKKALNSVWRVLIFVDFQIRNRFKIGFPLILGKTVISDRYVHDLIAGLSVSGLLTKKFVHLLLQSMPTPHLTFLLDAHEDVISARRGTPIAVLRRKRAKYLSLARALDLSLLNTSKDFAKNQQEIQRKTILLFKE